MKITLSISALLLAAGTLVAAEDHGECACLDKQLTSECKEDGGGPDGYGTPIWKGLAHKEDVPWCVVGDPKKSEYYNGLGCTYGTDAGPSLKTNNHCFTQCKKGL
ncbi:hypothetical protein N7492_007260 [Penicillium capsulatum]|uniref:Secreted protein n=1 Tax=Penicillium capsulatum TaxID=69766 RepID=A0A9W9LLM4_9EURO|nr:hypothetical protein N7492_007260 [Penicillium capsulatum]KAJ6117098.1 hypothetical protein N7512_006823 [Penicillium capsulatum]